MWKNSFQTKKLDTPDLNSGVLQQQNLFLKTISEGIFILALVSYGYDMHILQKIISLTRLYINQIVTPEYFDSQTKIRVINMIVEVLQLIVL